MNEVLFRKANDRIDQKAEEDGVIEPVAFYCECSDRDCTERIPYLRQRVRNGTRPPNAVPRATRSPRA